MAGRQKKHYDKSVYRSFALVMQFGINMLVPICLMSALGIWLDKKLDTSYWMVILFFVGAIAGGQNVFRMAKSIYAEQGKRNVRRQATLSDSIKAETGEISHLGGREIGVEEVIHKQSEGK